MIGAHKITKDTNKALRILKLLSHTTCGSETETPIKIFKSTIPAKLQYSSILYNSAKYALTKYIDSNHYTGMRLAIRDFKRSLIKSIYNIVGNPSPDLKITKLTLLYAAKSEIYRSTRLSRLTNNPASANKITLELKNNQDYSKILQIIKKKINNKPL